MFHEIFLKEIYPRYFEHLKQPDTNPDVYCIGGQPGSGKSVRERVLYADLNRNNPGTVIEINGDDFRAFHPDYYRLLTEDDATAASKIDQDNKFFIESCIKASAEKGVHVILEGTFRQPSIVQSTADFYHRHDYHSQAILLAVHPLLSRIGILRRYCEQKKLSPFARYTERRAHDAALNGLYETTESLISNKYLDNFTIIKQDGTILFQAYLKNLSKDTCDLLSTEAKDTVQQAHTHLSAEEIEFAHHELDIIGRTIDTLNIPKIVKNDYERLKQDVMTHGRRI